MLQLDIGKQSRRSPGNDSPGALGWDGPDPAVALCSASRMVGTALGTELHHAAGTAPERASGKQRRN